jgi:hypothetical protein
MRREALDMWPTQCSLTKSTVQRILRDNRMHAYHYTKVQHLLPEDYAPRVEFCTWLLEQHAENPFCWPARSPDLTPLDFFLWGHVKNLVYRVPVNNLDTLRNRIRDAMAMVTPEMLQNVRNNLLKRARLCIQAGGSRFEHLL